MFSRIEGEAITAHSEDAARHLTFKIDDSYNCVDAVK